MIRRGSWIAVSVLVSFTLLSTTAEANTRCDSLRYTPSNSTGDILVNLKRIVAFAEEQIREMEIEKTRLVEEMKKGEMRSVALAKEKKAKEDRKADLLKIIAELNVNINEATKKKNEMQRRINTVESSRIETVKSIHTTRKQIVTLQTLAANAQRALDAAIRKINEEKAKRKCYIGIGKRKRRRRKRRRAWGRRFFREVRRVVRQVTRETKRLIRRLKPCIIDNILSRMNNRKEKAQRDKRTYNRRLLEAQNSIRIKEANFRRLNVLKSTLLGQLYAMRSSLSKLVIKLNADNAALVQNTRDHTDVTNQITNLKKMLADLEVQLKGIRQKKSDVLDIITVLTIETQKKIGDIKDLEHADPDEREDILEDIAEINKDIKKSVAKLRYLLCVSQALYKDVFATIYKVRVPASLHLTREVIVATCRAARMTHVCNGPLRCNWHMPGCLHVLIEDIFCGGYMMGTSTRLCGAKKRPDECPALHGVFSPGFLDGCGALPGKYCAAGSKYVSTIDTPYYAFCAKTHS